MQTRRPETKTTNTNIKCSPLEHLHIQTCKKKTTKCEQQDQQQKQQMQTSSVHHLSFLTPCRFNANKETKTTNARSKCSPLKRLRIQTCKKNNNNNNNKNANNKIRNKNNKYKHQVFIMSFLTPCRFNNANNNTRNKSKDNKYKHQVLVTSLAVSSRF